MTCPHCEEREERIAWLESELGIQRDIDAYGRLREHLRRLPHNAGRSSAVKMILALYNAKRPLSRWQLMEATAPDSGEDHRDPKIIDVWICLARKSLGKSAIQTVWGQGYRMTDEGRALVGSIINPAPAAVAA